MIDSVRDNEHECLSITAALCLASYDNAAASYRAGSNVLVFQ